MLSALCVHTSIGGEDVLVGTCRFSLRRGTVSCTFSYEPSYLTTLTPIRLTHAWL